MFWSALVLGLISSLHCVAMCGPIAMMLPLSRYSPEKKALQLITYHLGRLSSYAALGLTFGILGRGFYLAGWQRELSIIAGIVMILIAIVPEKVLARYHFSKPVYRLIASAKASLGSKMKNPSLVSLFTIGLLNGLLPCTMVYAALFGAMAMQNLTAAMGFMLCFGLGTIPLMSVVVYINQWLTVPLRNKMQKIIPFAMACVGLLLIARGLSLGIHGVSPSATSLFITAQHQCH